MSIPRVYRIRQRAKLTRRLFGTVSRPTTLFILLFILLATALYSGSSASSFYATSPSRQPETLVRGQEKVVKGRNRSAKEASNQLMTRGMAETLPSLAATLLMPDDPLAPETVTTYDCDTLEPKKAFHFGDTVCAKIEGGPPLAVAPRRFSWVTPDNLIKQQSVVTALGQEDRFTIPPRDLNDYREVWRVNSISQRSSVRASAFFTVSDPNDETANLSIYNNVNFNTANVVSGSEVEFALWVVNRGPDAATNVSVATVGSDNTTFVSGAQEVGPTPAFSCESSTGGGTCTVASLPAGTKVRIVVRYRIDGDASAGTVITNTATISSDTNDARQADNSSTARAIVTIEADPGSCRLVCPNDITALANTTVNTQRGAIVKFDAEATGDCGGVTATPASGSFFPVGETTVTLQSVGDSGTVSCSFTVKVTDTAAPTISCPANIEKEAGTDCNAFVTEQELGAPTVSGGTGEVKVEAERDDGLTLDAPYPIGVTTITWTATDEVGRIVKCNQTVTVTGNDTTKPTITAPPDVVDYTGEEGATCGKIIGETQLGRAEADDSCSGVVTIIRTGLPAGNFFPIGTTTITYRAKDQSGNISDPVTQKVTVNDNTPPVIFAPPDASYECPSQVPAAAASQATGPDVLDANGQPHPGPPADNCGAPLVTISETSSGAGTASDPRIILRKFTATDVHGNSASAIQTITVTDSTPPTITAPGPVTFYTGENATSCGFTIANLDAALGTATASDNCAGVGVTRSGVPSGNTFPVGTTTVTYTATDWAGNTASANQVVTVIDNTPPVLNVADVVTYLPLNSTAVSMPVSYTVMATDNCDGALTPNVNPASGSIFPVGTTTVTATATDTKGNTTTKTFKVTVLYNFTGFFSPVENQPTLNQVNAGRAVPVKFSLSGNKGLNIFNPNNPSSGVIQCNSNDPVVDVSETITAGSSSLNYTASSDQYSYIWKTESSWAGTCRQLVIQLNDGSIHRANFKFK